jgi:hypothetical protein
VRSLRTVHALARPHITRPAMTTFRIDLSPVKLGYLNGPGPSRLRGA